MDWLNYSRKQRGMSQKLYLIEATDHFNYVIMGSTGNVYHVNISNSPTCTCPDHTTRHNRCKHIYFVLLRIMKVIDCEQEKYTNEEIEQMVKNINNIQNVSVDSQTQQKYHKLTEKNIDKLVDKNSNVSATDNIKGLDDLCPICLDDMENGEDYVFCKADCGRAVHKLCFDMWTKKNKPSCLYCKKAWKKEPKELTEGEYINLL
jgi:hypothetical protein